MKAILVQFSQRPNVSGMLVFGQNCSLTTESGIILSLYHNCDSTTIRLRYDDTTMHSTTTKVIDIMISVQFDCNMTMTRLRRKIDVFIFACIELEAGAHDTL